MYKMKALLNLMYVASLGMVYMNFGRIDPETHPLYTCKLTPWFDNCVSCCYNLAPTGTTVPCIQNICWKKPFHLEEYNVTATRECTSKSPRDWLSCIHCCVTVNDNQPARTNCSHSMCDDYVLKNEAR